MCIHMTVTEYQTTLRLLAVRDDALVERRSRLGNGEPGGVGPRRADVCIRPPRRDDLGRGHPSSPCARSSRRRRTPARRGSRSSARSWRRCRRPAFRGSSPRRPRSGSRSTTTCSTRSSSRGHAHGPPRGGAAMTASGPGQFAGRWRSAVAPRRVHGRLHGDAVQEPRRPGRGSADLMTADTASPPAAGGRAAAAGAAGRRRPRSAPRPGARRVARRRVPATPAWSSGPIAPTRSRSSSSRPRRACRSSCRSGTGGC